VSTRLVILGFLRGRSLYGYELKQLVEEIMGDWTNIAFGSIYYALDKLAQEGLVERIGTEQEGSRPSRTVYQITDAGRNEFLRLLRQVWDDVERHYFTFDIGLTFMEALPQEEVKGFLRKRVQQMEKIIQHLDEHQAEQTANEHTPSHFVNAVFEHSRVHFVAELGWTRRLLENVEQGVYDTEIKWMRNMMTQVGQAQPS